MKDRIAKFIVLGTGLLIGSLTMGQVSAQPNMVDVYFITGQSNAGNFSEMNSNDVQGYNGYNAADFNNQSDAGFNLAFGRIRDRPGSADGSVTDFVEDFSSNLLDPTNYAVDNLAVQINAEFGTDLGIFGYGRNGKPLANFSDDGGESWFPGTVASPFNDELYGLFLAWSEDRLTEVENGPDGVAGTADDQIANVKGVFWFQGERDVIKGSENQYQTNFENLVARFRADFNDPELPIVASEIRQFGTSGAEFVINAALNAVAAADANVAVIDISNAAIYTSGSTNDVHLNANGLNMLSNDFAQEMISLQSVIEIAPTINGTNVTNHNHISTNFNHNELRDIGAEPNAGAISVTESPFFDLAAPSGGLSGDLGFNNNPNAPDAPETSPIAMLSGSYTIVGNSTEAGGFADGNALPIGVTASYDISFSLSTTTGALLSAPVGEANGLGAGDGGAFFTPANNNFSGNLVFGAATISNVVFTGSAPAGFTFSAGSVDSVDLLGLRSATFTGTNNAELRDMAGNVVADFTTTNPAPAGETFLNATNDNLFVPQPLGDAVFAVTNGGAHIQGFTLGVNFSYDIEEIVGLTGDFDDDNDVDVDDINYYAGNIGAAATGVLAQLDLNGDGQITLADLKIHVETYVQTSNGETGTFLGDANLDGVVDVLGDAAALVNNLGSSNATWAQGDFNGDGNVDVLGDAATLVENLGNSNAQ